jgi:hypothetical protein
MSAKDFFHNAVRLALEKDGILRKEEPENMQMSNPKKI